MSQAFHSLSDSEFSDNEYQPIFDHIDPPILAETCSKPQDILKPTQKTKAPRKTKQNREEQQKKKEKFKHISPGTCLDYLLIFIDKGLTKNNYFCEIITDLEKGKVPVITHETLTNSITWKRKQISGDYSEEPYMLILWDHVFLLQNIEKCLVNDYFKVLKNDKPNYGIYLVVYGLRDYCRRLRKKKNLTSKELTIGIVPSKEIVEHVLTEIQVMMGISHRLFDEKMELVSFINHLTKSIAEEPYRKEKEKHELEKTSYLQGSSRSCVKIDKQNNGMLRLWQQQLAQIPMSSLDYAKAISALYPSPFALYQAYNVISNKEERENLLQNIAIGREGSKKRIGPEMSKRICHMFSSQDII